MLVNTKKIRQAYALGRITFAKQRRRFVLMAALGLIAGVLGSIGIGAVIPLFSLITKQPSPVLDSVSKIISDVFVYLQIPLTPIPLISFIGLLFVSKAVVQFAALYLNSQTVGYFEEKVRQSLMEKTLRADWPFLMNQKAGHLGNIMIYDMERTSAMVNLIANIIFNGANFIIYVVVAFLISPVVTVATIIIGSILFLIFKPFFSRIRKLISRSAEIQRMVSHHVAENIMGAKIIKALTVENNLIEKSAEYFKELRNSKIDAAFLRQLTLSFNEPIGFFVIAAIFFISYHKPGFNIASFAVVIYLIQKIFDYIKIMQGQIHSINENIPFLDSVFGFERLANQSKEPHVGKMEFKFSDSIEFRDIQFTYPSRSKKPWNFSFSIKKGDMVGIVGPSGSGKTTLVDLFLRLLKPKQGEIYMDGKNIEDIDLYQWRKKIGYVSQETFLFNDTIGNNIRFYDQAIPQEKILKAAKIANINQTIEAFPKGFDTIVGERGVELSGGQRQRIALARVLARDPEILILDEATSAIDSESEAAIQDAIQNMKGSITIVMITHRVSAVQNVDKIVAIDDGRVIEEGSPESLLSNPESYFYRINQVGETNSR